LLSLQKFDSAFFFTHANQNLEMSVTWKCFDGTQRTDISDVRNEFRFQANKAFVSVTV